MSAPLWENEARVRRVRRYNWVIEQPGRVLYLLFGQRGGWLVAPLWWLSGAIEEIFTDWSQCRDAVWRVRLIGAERGGENVRWVFNALGKAIEEWGQK